MYCKRMASPGVVSNVSASSPGSEGSGDQPQRAVMEERKRRRKESNRLSAQRSRERKKLQMGELEAQVAALLVQNGALVTAARAAAQRCAAVQAENELLRARTMELDAHLQSLTDLLQCMDASAATAFNPFAIAAAATDVPPPLLLDAAMYCNYY